MTSPLPAITPRVTRTCKHPKDPDRKHTKRRKGPKGCRPIDPRDDSTPWTIKMDPPNDIKSAEALRMGQRHCSRGFRERLQISFAAPIGSEVVGGRRYTHRELMGAPQSAHTPRAPVAPPHICPKPESERTLCPPIPHSLDAATTGSSEPPSGTGGPKATRRFF